MSSFASNFQPYKISILTNGVRLPEVKISTEEKAALGLAPDASSLLYLKKLTWKKCKEKLASGVIKQSEKECIERLKMEFDVFEKTGTTDYILLLVDVFGWCDKNGIARSPARGSAGSSFSLYCLGLIEINALEDNLNFPRFLSEARAKCKVIDGVKYLDGKSMADFDGDIDQFRREEVIKRLERDYAGKVCKISTAQYLTGKMALKDVLKIYKNYSEGAAKEVSDNIEVVFGKVKSLEESYKAGKAFRVWVDENKDCYNIARKLEGLYRTSGIHASGILVSYYDMGEYMPRELSATKEVVSGYSMDHALPICCKVDILGLRTVSFIKEACEIAGISKNDIDENDPAIYDFLEREDNYYGLFQIEEGATKEACRRVKPKTVNHVKAVVAISRPGALQYLGAFADYVNKGEFKSVHPEIDKVLKETGNIIIYQEQITDICHRVYGISLVDSDMIRYSIGKKNREKMAEWEPVIRKNGKERGIPDEVTDWFWNTCNASADYLFNACLAPDTVVETPSGEKLLYEVRLGDKIRAYDTKADKDHYVEVTNSVWSEEELYEVETEDGHIVRCSMKHKILCEDLIMRPLSEIITGKHLIAVE
jgi:DNA polymerase III subunit alpha